MQTFANAKRHRVVDRLVDRHHIHGTRSPSQALDFANGLLTAFRRILTAVTHAEYGVSHWPLSHAQFCKPFANGKHRTLTRPRRKVKRPHPSRTSNALSPRGMNARSPASLGTVRDSRKNSKAPDLANGLRTANRQTRLQTFDSGGLPFAAHLDHFIL